MIKVIGVPNGLAAKQCLARGFDHLYLSSAHLHSFEHALADLNILSFEDTLKNCQRFSQSNPSELWVDIDAGQCSNHQLSYFIDKLVQSGATGVQIEDQPLDKRCGHRPDKSIVKKDRMIERIKAIKTTVNPPKVIARTDALALERSTDFQERLESYQEAGADIIFVEALTDNKQVGVIKQYIDIPLMVNRTEFGLTPNLSDSYWGQADYHLFPLTLSRLMHKVVDKALESLCSDHGQEHLAKEMLTREELYELIDYHRLERSYKPLN